MVFGDYILVFFQAPLILAVEENMLQAAESLVDASVDVTGINYQTMDNVLHISAKNTNAPMLRMFQEKSNPDVLVKLVNKVNETGLLPFLWFFLFSLNLQIY